MVWLLGKDEKRETDRKVRGRSRKTSNDEIRDSLKKRNTAWNEGKN